MTIEKILDLHFKNNYQQQSFSILPFIVRADALAGDHQIIVDTIEFVKERGLEEISRKTLLDLYADSNVELFKKIFITFWWGGLSHQNQAPLFYKKENLKKIELFYKDFENDLNNSLLNEANDFQNSFNKIFNEVLFGRYKMNGIGYAFFTKIFQFFYEAKKSISNHDLIPIISDKWSMRSVFGYSILEGKPVTFFRKINAKQGDLELKFRGYDRTYFSRYWQFVIYFNELSTELSERYIGLTPFRLEEIFFGWQRDLNNPENPRNLFTNAIAEYYGIGIEIFENEEDD